MTAVIQDMLAPRALDPARFPWLETLLRLGCAALCGLAVGWEREVKQRPAGLRTHALVALGSGIFTICAVEVQAAAVQAPPLPDVLRVVGAIAGGIGFLGAGAIIQSRGEICGLTTAAGLWVVAALGVASGLASYALVAIGTAMTLLILAVLKAMERRIGPGDAERG